ncbi:cryptochrome/photolyase family protein [Sanguibacter suaedae]|uniref:Deoxyribodipyrimidine photo-lyase n=1 Tax=Sanguibacter suaedae TaxID=2795737 RepID=A0A934M6Q3_9MICO|nr:deoxyribodipyrimidine photo-lyase [Sanguibacter suaedae]MBI9114507.1 deoxyribodipyrimidine photo-lyase [Sanguibacter suaedae]
MTTIHWFRRDLRLSDNPALLAAAREAAADGDDLVGLFVVDDSLCSVSGGPRLSHLARSLAALDEQMGGRLVVRRGDPAVVVPSVAMEVTATAVHVTGVAEPRGRARDSAVGSALGAAGVRLVSTGTPYAVSPGRLRTGAGTGYRVFTPFRRAWYEHGWPSPAPALSGARWADVPGEGLPPTAAGAAAGENHALRRWHAYLDDVDRYAQDRDRPDLDTTSRMSVPLKWGEIHPRTMLADLRTLSGVGPDAFRSQIAWRDFHADVLFHAPDAAHSSLRQVLPDDSWAPAAVADPWFDAWTAGRTGYPVVDAGMRQLLAEGWMHGRLRMIVASFLVKDLHVPWQRGAAHFMAHLVDGDVAQNQLNWQWVAGTGLDAAPYFRIFNPVTQGLKFDPDGDYVRRWVPELRDVPGKAVHEPWKLSRLPTGYPERLVDHAEERRVTLADYERHRRA